MEKYPRLIEIIIKSDYEFKDVTPYCYGEHACGKKHSYGPVARPCWMLCYILSGTGILKVENEEYRVNAGQCFVLPPYTRSFHMADGEDPWHYIWIEFYTTLKMPEMLNKYVIDARFMEHVFLSMRRVQQLRCDRGIWFAQKIYELLACIQEKEATYKTGAKYYVDSAKNIIETEPYRDNNVSSLAARLGLNRSYFSSIFKEQTGMSPAEYIARNRLEKAGEFITLHGYSVSSAADALGYADIYSFSKAFKRFYGVTPTDYRKQWKSE